MSLPDDHSPLIERLRTNLRTAGIPVTAEDLDGIVRRDFLRVVANFERIARSVPPATVPDALKGWGDDLPAVEPGGLAAGLPATTPTRPAVAGVERSASYPSLAETAERVRQGDISPVELTQESLTRIVQRDTELNAFQLVLPERALDAARRAEREIAAGDYRGPLHGIPLAIKDLLALAGTPTTAGSKVLADWVPDFDADAVSRLEQAGAVIVGKTRLSEFAYSPASNNAHYGWTHNPWNLEHDTGGSSSGSGAAVAAGLVFGALGSDTGGSIRIPAALCGLVGLKPTFGRVSLFGAIPLAWSLDHLGPMTRTVEDAALVLQVLAGFDPRDPRTRRVPVPDYQAGLGAGVRGLRIGVIRSDGSGDPLATPDVLAAWQQGLAALEHNGAELVELDLPDTHDLRMLNSAIVGLEASAYHEPMLRARLDDFGEFMRHRVLSAFAYGPTTATRASQARALYRQRFNAIYEQVDLLSTPTVPSGAPVLGDPATNTWFTGPFNALGWPAISVPVGLTGERLPVGLQLIGRPWDELTVLQAAMVVESDGPWPGGMP